MSVADYNTDPNSNTSISGINIAEGCPPSGINNAIRQMMADVKTADNANVKITGAQTIGGAKTFTTHITMSGAGANTIQRTEDDSAIYVCGASSITTGAFLTVSGKDRSTNAGAFSLRANDGGSFKDLIGKPDGTLTWDSKNFIYDSGAQTIGGAKTFTSHITMSGSGANTILRAEDDSAIYVCGATSISNGAVLTVSGKDRSTNAGVFSLRARNSSTYKDLIGKPDGTLTWNGQNIQTTSDERLKTPIADVPDAVLDAWGDVGWGQFQYLDAVEAKGADKARLHLGLIAQHVKEVFEARGLDACAYGILCHEEHPATDEDPAVDVWMVRYTEAAAMEAAYQRRRADRAEARLASVEERLAALEARI